MLLSNVLSSQKLLGQRINFLATWTAEDFWFLCNLRENLQFSLKTESFQSLGKTFSFSLKTVGNTNFSLKLKLKVFQ